LELPRDVSQPCQRGNSDFDSLPLGEGINLSREKVIRKEGDGGGKRESGSNAASLWGSAARSCRGKPVKSGEGLVKRMLKRKDMRRSWSFRHGAE